VLQGLVGAGNMSVPFGRRDPKSTIVAAQSNTTALSVPCIAGLLFVAGRSGQLGEHVFGDAECG
jgi:hypothetical protein